MLRVPRGAPLCTLVLAEAASKESCGTLDPMAGTTLADVLVIHCGGGLDVAAVESAVVTFWVVLLHEFVWNLFSSRLMAQIAALRHPLHLHFPHRC